MNTSSAPSATPRTLRLAAAAAVLLVVGLGVLQRQLAPAAAGTAPTPAAPAAPAPVRPAPLELLHAETFRLDQGYFHRYRSDTPAVDRGWLLVIAGDAAALATRQMKMPVLYVGAQTAERINQAPTGKLVVLVPGDFRLQDAPIFLGSPALPEELRQDQIDAELAAARAAGVEPPAAALVSKVTQPGRTYADDWELRQRAIDLVEQFSPGEVELIRGWRVPRVK